MSTIIERIYSVRKFKALINIHSEKVNFYKNELDLLQEKCDHETEDGYWAFSFNQETQREECSICGKDKL